jgi:Ran GTPase-activating protein (RanGAP) involved in mRNA processing and transport
VAEILQQVVDQNISLCYLDMSFNAFTHHGIQLVAHAIHKHQSLQTWNISGNWIGNEAWTDILMTTRLLDELIMEQCLAPSSTSSPIIIHLPFIYGRKHKKSLFLHGVI